MDTELDDLDHSFFIPKILEEPKRHNWYAVAAIGTTLSFFVFLLMLGLVQNPTSTHAPSILNWVGSISSASDGNAASLTPFTSALVTLLFIGAYILVSIGVITLTYYQIRRGSSHAMNLWAILCSLLFFVAPLSVLYFIGILLLPEIMSSTFLNVLP